MKNINNRVTPSKTIPIGAKKELADHVQSYIKLLNDLAKEDRLISIKK